MASLEEEKQRIYTFEDLLNEQGFIIYTNVGFSMMPLLRQKRDIIEIRKKDSGRCKKYDVVLYKRGERYILHRILKVLPDGYLIAGDHCRIVEKDIKDEHILGVLTRIMRDGKEITPDNKWYKLYVHLWCDLYPVRMQILNAKIFIRRCIGFMRRRIYRINVDEDSSNTVE